MDFQDIVIGGGASGMTAAILLARSGRKVAVLEAQDRVLKKVLASGNGRCNLSNVAVSPKRYNAPSFVASALEAFEGKLAPFFNSVGLELREEDGRIYPFSLSANNVVNALLRAAEKAGVAIFCGAKAEKIIKEEKIHVLSGKTTYRCDNLIFAAGSNATSGTDSLALLAENGHSVTERYASVSSVPCASVRGASGVRAKAALTLKSGEEKIFYGQGELLFKDNSLSGILAFEASSRYVRALRQGKKCLGSIDFAPEKRVDEIENFIRTLDCDCVDALCAYLHRALAAAAVKKAGAVGNACDNAGTLARTLKDYPLEFSGVCDIKNAQVVSGGLSLDGFDPVTMRSLFVKRLYATGEALDVDGDCGGFNLHWAWASAFAAAKDVCGGKLCSD